MGLDPRHRMPCMDTHMHAGIIRQAAHVLTCVHTQASFDGPHGLVLLPGDVLLITDMNNQRIRHVMHPSRTRVCTTFDTSICADTCMLSHTRSCVSRTRTCQPYRHTHRRIDNAMSTALGSPTAVPRCVHTCAQVRSCHCLPARMMQARVHERMVWQDGRAHTAFGGTVASSRRSQRNNRQPCRCELGIHAPTNTCAHARAHDARMHARTHARTHARR